MGRSWRLDETYIRVKGDWRYLYRAVDKPGQTIDFLLTEHRDQEAALRFLKKAIRRGGMPEKITIDGSEANEAAIKRYNEEHGTAIIIRQVKYLNNRHDLAGYGLRRRARRLGDKWMGLFRGPSVASARATACLCQFNGFPEKALTPDGQSCLDSP